jgi:copper(I)-binding protein
MKTKQIILLFAAGLLLAACGPRTLSVHDAWTRPTQQGGTAAVYFELSNGSQADTLLGASADLAGVIEIHRSSMAGMENEEGEHDMHDMDDMQSPEDLEEMENAGVMVMQALSELPVAAQEKISFEPGSYHLMLIGIEQELQAGTTFTLTLHFANAGDVPIEVEVLAP